MTPPSLRSNYIRHVICSQTTNIHSITGNLCALTATTMSYVSVYFSLLNSSGSQILTTYGPACYKMATKEPTQGILGCGSGRDDCVWFLNKLLIM